MLLAPYAILKGARPVWVALGQETLLGSGGYDEIVIIEYPSHHTLLDIFTGRYYEGINGLRERGVRSLGFSIAEQLGVDPVDLSHGPSLDKGSHLVVRFGGAEVDEEVFDSVAKQAQALGEPEYVAREIGRLDIFSDPSPTDPATVELPNILVFPDTMPDSETVEAVDVLSQQANVELAVQRFRTLGLAEALGLK
jgi:hypothetical protein